MANEIIRPSALPPRANPVASEVTVSDNGASVAGVTWTDGVNAAAPVASQAQAEAGVNNVNRMTSLTTKQAIDAQVPVIVSAAIGGLNLGSASQANVGDFATAAQGLTADSAVQPGDLAAVATSGDYDDLSGLPTLGTAAATDADDYATAAQGVPPGGLTGQVLAKASDGDNDVQWSTVSGGGGSDDSNAESRAWAIANLHPTTAPAYIQTAGYSAAGDGGGALYNLVGSEPSHAGKFSITLEDGVTVAWFEIAETELTDRMFGAPCDSTKGSSGLTGTDGTAAIQAWLNCPVSNLKRFTGVTRVTNSVSAPVGTKIIGEGKTTGITGKHLASFTGFGLLQSKGSYIAGPAITANIAKGATRITVASTASLVEGDHLIITNPTASSYSTARSEYKQGEPVRVQRILSSTQFTLMSPTYDAYTASAVTTHILRSDGLILEDFFVEGPARMENKSSIEVDTIAGLRIRNVEAGTTEWGCGSITRCIDFDLDTDAFQDYDLSTSNEYGWGLYSVHAGSIKGNYYAQRHGIALGQVSSGVCYPNRKIDIYCNTDANYYTGSIDVGGHGCSEYITVHGGHHRSAAIGGGGNIRFIGSTFRSGLSQYPGSDSGGDCLYGSEFKEGDYIFDACTFESYFDNTIGGTVATGMIDIRLLPSAVGKCKFFFNNCRFKPHPSSNTVMCFYVNGGTGNPSVYVNGGMVDGGTGLTSFARFVKTGGSGGSSTLDAVLLLDLEGLNSAATAAPTSVQVALSITRRVVRFPAATP